MIAAPVRRFMTLSLVCRASEIVNHCQREAAYRTSFRRQKLESDPARGAWLTSDGAQIRTAPALRESGPRPFLCRRCPINPHPDTGLHSIHRMLIDRYDARAGHEMAAPATT